MKDKEPLIDRDKLIRAHFNAYSDLLWVQELESKFRQYNLGPADMERYRQAWNRHTEARDWQWWLDKVKGVSSAKLHEEIAACEAEINAIRKQRPCQRVGIRGTLRQQLDRVTLPDPIASKELTVAPQPDPQTIRKMLDDVQAVINSRFYEDPQPIASPIEMFRMPQGKKGGEPFADLSAREKGQVLGDYTDWQDYQQRGITFEQMDQVYLNVINGKPRDKWLEGTGLPAPAPSVQAKAPQKLPEPPAQPPRRPARVARTLGEHLNRPAKPRSKRPKERDRTR
jgi:hypothetical protein